MRQELIKYVLKKANEQFSDDFPIEKIETWINEFFELKQNENPAFILKGSNDCIALPATPSNECIEFHKSSCIQFNIPFSVLKELKNDN